MLIASLSVTKRSMKWRREITNMAEYKTGQRRAVASLHKMVALRVAGALLLLLAAAGVRGQYDCYFNVCLQERAGAATSCIVNRTCDTSAECSGGECVTEYSNVTRDAILFEYATDVREHLASSKDVLTKYLNDETLGAEESQAISDLLDFLLSAALDSPAFPLD